MTEVLIRPAEPSDATALTALFEEFYTRFNMEQTLTGEVKELLRVDDAHAFAVDTIQSYFDDHVILFVAIVAQQIVGYAAGEINTKKHYLHAPEAELIDWFVTEAHRGSGIGRQLYDVFIRDVKAKGCKSLSVEAFAENTKTIKTYERLGLVKDSVILKKRI